jgi:hypothetical protein
VHQHEGEGPLLDSGAANIVLDIIFDIVLLAINIRGWLSWLRCTSTQEGEAEAEAEQRTTRGH